MSKALITEQTLTDIANNIRANGDVGTMTPTEMAEEVKTRYSIDIFFQSNPFTPIKEEITIHPTLTVIDYKLSRTNLAKKINLIFSSALASCFRAFSYSTVEEVYIEAEYFNNPSRDSQYAFEDCKQIKKITFNARNLPDDPFTNPIGFGGHMFQDCSNLKTIVTNKAIRWMDSSSGTFTRSGITDDFFKTNLMIKTSTGFAGSNFYGCLSLNNVDLTHFIGENTSTKFNFGGSVFAYSTNLKSILIPDTENTTYTFGNTVFAKTALSTFIITSHIVATISSGTFQQANISFGDGFIYVPDNLVDSYKVATNWVVYADQIKPISELPQEYKTIYGL